MATLPMERTKKGVAILQKDVWERTKRVIGGMIWLKMKCSVEDGGYVDRRIYGCLYKAENKKVK